MKPFIQTQSFEKTLTANREIWQKPKQNYEKAINERKYDYTERCVQLLGYGHRIYDYGKELCEMANTKDYGEYPRASVHLISGIWTCYWSEKKRLFSEMNVVNK